MPLRLEQRVQVDISGIQIAVVPFISGPRWVDGVVAEVDADDRVTVLLRYPVDGKKRLRVARSRIKAP